MSDLEGALNAWLATEVGVDEPRRVVRADAERILVSKVAPGFTPDLHRLLRSMPELFEEESVVAACARRARVADPETPRSESWRAAMHELLAAAGERQGIQAHRLAEVRTAIDSVFAVLDAVLWSRSALGDEYAPRPGEVEAYLEGVARLDSMQDLFRRYYGEFEGRSVENHCPGAPLAKAMLAHAWRACTGAAPPSSNPAEIRGS